MTHNSMHDIETDLVAVKFKVLREFYGDLNYHYFQMQNRTNYLRLKDIDNISVDRMIMLVDACSGGMWTLKKERFITGFTMIPWTVQLKEPMEVINNNFWIARNLSLITKMNAMYQHKDGIE